MQILAETEYQDLYRVMDGVLLVVNKFEPIIYPTINRPYHLYSNNVKTKKYNKNCQDGLKELKADYFDHYLDITILKGTVMYNGLLVKPTDPSNYTYQIKTTGDAFSGKREKIEDYLSEILYRIRQGEVTGW